MALQLQYKSKQQGILRMAGTVMAVFALLIQPMYGLVASQVANAVSATVGNETELRNALSEGKTEIDLSGNIGVSSQISVNYSTTFNGGTITALTPGTYGSDDAVVYVSGTGVVFTANNTVFDGNNQGSKPLFGGNSSDKRRQGVKVYGGATANLNSVTIKNAKKSGLHVNGSSIANVTDVTTSGNGALFGGLVVSGGGTINIDGKSTHDGEAIPARIDGSGTINDNNDQYTTGNIRWLKSAPGAPAITAPASPVTTSSADLTWTAPSTSGNKNAAESYIVSINGGVATSASGLTHPLTGLSDGNYTATVQSVAKSGLLGGTATHNFTVSIPDTEKPEGSATYTGGYLNPTTNVRYVKNIEDLSFTVNASDNKGVAWATYRAWNVAQSGVEACGNWNTGAPTAHIFAAPLQKSISYTVPGSSVKTCGSSMKWETGSRYQFIHAVYDAAGNESEKFNGTNQLVEIDSTQPIINIVKPLADSTVKGIVPIEVEVTENGSGLKYVNALFTDGSTPEFGHKALELKAGTTDTYIGEIDTAGKDGKFSLGINVGDNVGNTRSAKAQNITIDNTAPEGSVEYISSTGNKGVDDGIWYVKSAEDLKYTVTGSDDGSGLRYAPFMVTRGIINDSGNFNRTDREDGGYDYCGGWTFNAIFDFVGNERTGDMNDCSWRNSLNKEPKFEWQDGVYQVAFRIYDNAGNIKDLNPPQLFVIDSTAPSVLSATLDGNAANIARTQNCGPTDFTLVGSSFTLGVNTDDVSGTDRVRYRVAKVSDGGCTQTGIYRSGWVTMNSTGTEEWTGPAFDTTVVPEDGNYTIEIETRDSLGNIAGHRYVDITIDSTAPTTEILSASVDGDSLSFTGNVSDPNLRYYYCWLTTNQIVTIDGHTFTPGQEIKLNGNTDSTRNAACNTTWASGETDFTGTIGGFDITGVPDGDYTINLVAYDLAGNNNVSSPATHIFTIDRTPPAIAITSATPTLISGTVDSDATTVWVKIGSGAEQEANINDDGTWSLAISPALAVGTHSITARAVDAAGNPSTVATFDFTRDPDSNGSNVVVQGVDTDRPQGGFTLPAAASLPITPLLASGMPAMVAFAEPDTDAEVDSDTASPRVVLGEQTEAAAAASATDSDENGCWKIFGLCWYWWVGGALVILAIIGYMIKRSGGNYDDEIPLKRQP